MVCIVPDGIGFGAAGIARDGLMRGVPARFVILANHGFTTVSRGKPIGAMERLRWIPVENRHSLVRRSTVARGRRLISFACFDAVDAGPRCNSSPRRRYTGCPVGAGLRAYVVIVFFDGKRERDCAGAIVSYNPV
ncbi:hypothetical protein [Burkholderia perseverans]|uniref:hypothetical protein n=1 Tax=Burkholderia perseverans TaxID=2615214 RepID=UPI001FED9AC7|nr:hypothetical protein [Burkholderia perseverans]